MPKKLKIGKTKNLEIDIEKILEKRIFIPKIIKYGTLGLIGIILLFSAVNAYELSQQPTTKIETNNLLSYSQTGNYNYKAYLKNNTVYNGKEYLSPNEGNLFRKLVNNITGSFSYNFYISNTSQISGNYKFLATIKTSEWSKTYTLINTKNFNLTNSTTYSFTENFPINYSFYEQKITEITNETGVGVQNAELIIKCNIKLTASSENANIYKSFTPAINISLRKQTIDISDKLTFRSADSKTEQKTINIPDIKKEKNMWTNITYAFLGITLVVFALTKTEKKPISKLQRKFRNIKKKYREYIIEIEEPLNPEGVEYIHIKSMDDLIRLSEEMGKPIFYYDNPSESTEKYEFFVLEEYTYYVFSLK
jgi:hypothetical protein